MNNNNNNKNFQTKVYASFGDDYLGWEIIRCQFRLSIE
jgi:hypothetical protein